MLQVTFLLALEQNFHGNVHQLQNLKIQLLLVQTPALLSQRVNGRFIPRIRLFLINFPLLEPEVAYLKLKFLPELRGMQI